MSKAGATSLGPGGRWGGGGWVARRRAWGSGGCRVVDEGDAAGVAPEVDAGEGLMTRHRSWVLIRWYGQVIGP